MPFCEPGLGELLAKSAGRLRFGTKPDGVVHEAGAIFVCVATPQGEDGSADLSSVAAVAGSRGRGRWRKGRGRTENARFWWPTRARSRWEAGTTALAVRLAARLPYALPSTLEVLYQTRTYLLQGSH